ncbi:unnamed protein product, partial [marine sediment metagenome]
TFVGLQNYLVVFNDSVAIGAFKNTLIFVAMIVPLGMILSLGLALLLSRFIKPKFKLREAYKLFYFLPVITNAVAVSLVWQGIYQPRFGLLNGVLASLGFSRQGFLYDPSQALASIAVFSLWQMCGYYMIIYLAGLENIPPVFYEAARIDGASKLQCFRYITLPLLAPITLFVVILWTIGSLQVFTPVYVMTQGGPINSTNVAVLYIYKSAFEYLKLGYGSSLAVVLFLLIFSITGLQLKISRWGKTVGTK